MRALAAGVLGAARARVLEFRFRDSACSQYEAALEVKVTKRTGGVCVTYNDLCSEDVLAREFECVDYGAELRLDRDKCEAAPESRWDERERVKAVMINEFAVQTSEFAAKRCECVKAGDGWVVRSFQLGLGGGDPCSDFTTAWAEMAAYPVVYEAECTAFFHAKGVGACSGYEYESPAAASTGGGNAASAEESSSSMRWRVVAVIVLQMSVGIAVGLQCEQTLRDHSCKFCCLSLIWIPLGGGIVIGCALRYIAQQPKVSAKYMIARNNAWASPDANEKRGDGAHRAYDLDTVGRLRLADAQVSPDPDRGAEGRADLEAAAGRAAERFAAMDKRGSGKKGAAAGYRPVHAAPAGLPSAPVEDFAEKPWAVPGASAEITGLQNAEYLNGTVGTLGRLDGDRWVVQLPTGDVRKIRPANLRPAAVQPSSPGASRRAPARTSLGSAGEVDDVSPPRPALSAAAPAPAAGWFESVAEASQRAPAGFPQPGGAQPAPQPSRTASLGRGFQVSKGGARRLGR